MARITVEDCLQNINNRFELVLAASKRARQLSREAIDPLVPNEGDKVTVLALREIATGLIGKNIEDPLLKTESPKEETDEISAEIIAETQTTADEPLLDQDVGLDSIQEE